jgi:hypothetical protein
MTGLWLAFASTAFAQSQPPLEQLAPISPASPTFTPHTIEPFTPNLPAAPQGSAQAGLQQQPPPNDRPAPPPEARVSPK